MIRIATFASVSLSVLMLVACQPANETADASSTESTPAATTTSATPAADVLTAEGLGPLRIGMTTAEVTAVMGGDSDPEAVGGPEPESCDQWRPERAPADTLVMIEQGRLTSITAVDNSPLRTDRGFGIGSTAAEIKAAYGDALLVEPHKYVEGGEYLTVWNGPKPTNYVEDPAARGVSYETNAEGRVTSVHVGGPSIQYVEGCA